MVFLVHKVCHSMRVKVECHNCGLTTKTITKCDYFACFYIYSKTGRKVPLKNGEKILMTKGSLMQVESIAECSPWSILQYF